MSNQDGHIIIDKELRRDIDAIIQRVKLFTGEIPLPIGGQYSETTLSGCSQPRQSRERSLAVTKLQEAVMWLGMDLKAINDENPIPAKPRPSRDEIHHGIATLVSDVIRRYNTGESIMGSHEAEDFCERYIDAGAENPYPNSKDPSNTKIEPTADSLKF